MFILKLIAIALVIQCILQVVEQSCVGFGLRSTRMVESMSICILTHGEKEASLLKGRIPKRREAPNKIKRCSCEILYVNFKERSIML